MKKYLSGVFPLILAISLNAFATLQNPGHIIVVEFLGDDNSETEIGNPANWREFDPYCSSVDEATVCSVEYNDTFEAFKVLIEGKDLDQLLVDPDISDPKYLIE